MKICSKCKEEKEMWEFGLHKNRPDGLYNWCKDCVKENRTRNKKYERESQYQKRYGITLYQYNLMLKAQGKVCAICKQPETRKQKSGVIQPLSVDHCHKTYKVRGLLCNNCNNGIGRLKDDPELLRKAAQYLEKSR